MGDTSGQPIYGFETVPVTPVAIALVACLAMQALGPPIVILEIILFAAIVAISWRQLPAVAARSWLLLLLPTAAMFSVMWSQVPSISARYAVQLLATIGVGIVLAATIPRGKLVLTLFAGLSIAMVIGFLSGRTGMSAEGAVPIGFTGSKNQMAYVALFWMAASLCAVADRGLSWLTRLASLVCVSLSAAVIWQGASVTAMLSAVAVVVFFALLSIAGTLPRGGRLFILLAAALFFAAGTLGLAQIENYADTARSEVLGKDTRLTGRTVLWEAADRLIEEKPLLGHGYKAIWLGDGGVGLLARNGQTDGRAFHFHDTFREIRADLGWAGLIAFLAPLGFGLARLAGLFIERITVDRALAGGIFLLLCLRMRTELIVAPLLIDTVFLFLALAFFTSARRPDPARNHSPQHSTKSRNRGEHHVPNT
ncbi:O-antigen ligase family protein [Qipengyuania seohaensis]|uniref:O-antigen ligase family protein n=1 Tax=Qipengyuania seohaensis TaxID=266951 RepID=UPI0018E22AF5|nr:O-antigen ligase family protein [Qipengyuania seohaensis]